MAKSTSNNLESITESVSKPTKLKSTNNIFDLSKIIDSTRSVYDKSEKGLAAQISTGTSIKFPTDDKDFVLWTFGSTWESLTGMRGIPFGRIVQISGKADSGKSTHAMCFMKAAQDQGYLVILWDAEEKFSKSRFETHMQGDASSLATVRTNNILNGAKAIAHLVRVTKSLYPDTKILIVWDSVGACVNSKEDTDDDEEEYSKQPGVTAKEVSDTVRKFNKLIHKYVNKETGEHSIAVLAINQTYSSIGMGAPTQIEKGGTELFYLSSLIVQLSRKSDVLKIKNGISYKHGIISRAKVKKNHLFEGDSSVSELDILISADGVKVPPLKRTKSDKSTAEEWADGDSTLVEETPDE